MVLLTIGWVLPYQSLTRKCPHVLPTGQSYEDIFSTAVLSSQTTLTSIGPLGSAPEGFKVNTPRKYFVLSFTYLFFKIKKERDALA